MARPPSRVGGDAIPMRGVRLALRDTPGPWSAPRRLAGIPRARGRSIEDRIDEGADDREGAVECAADGEQRAARLGRVARLPEPAVRNIEALGQGEIAAVELGLECGALRGRVESGTRSDRDEVDQLAVAPGRPSAARIQPLVAAGAISGLQIP